MVGRLALNVKLNGVNVFAFARPRFKVGARAGRRAAAARRADRRRRDPQSRADDVGRARENGPAVLDLNAETISCGVLPKLTVYGGSATPIA